MVNHPKRRISPDTPIEGAALSRLLHRAEHMTHEVAAALLSERERNTLAAYPELIADIGVRWQLTPAGKVFARSLDHRDKTAPVDPNRIWWLVRKLADISDDEAVDACTTAGLDISRSRVNGWRKHPADRKHVKMSMDDLEAVLVGLLTMDGIDIND